MSGPVKNAGKRKRGITNSDDPEQSKRFIDMAREIGADESGEAFDRAIDKIMSKRRHAKASVGLGAAFSHRSSRKDHS